MNKLNNEKTTVVTYEISLLDNSRVNDPAPHNRFLSRCNQISLVLRNAGFNVLTCDRQHPEIEPDIFMPEIMALTGLSKSSIHNLSHLGQIPLRKRGNKLCAKRSEILRWQEERV